MGPRPDIEKLGSAVAVRAGWERFDSGSGHSDLRQDFQSKRGVRIEGGDGRLWSRFDRRSGCVALRLTSQSSMVVPHMIRDGRSNLSLHITHLPKRGRVQLNKMGVPDRGPPTELVPLWGPSTDRSRLVGDPCGGLTQTLSCEAPARGLGSLRWDRCFGKLLSATQCGSVLGLDGIAVWMRVIGVAAIVVGWNVTRSGDRHSRSHVTLDRDSVTLSWGVPDPQSIHHRCNCTTCLEIVVAHDRWVLDRRRPRRASTREFQLTSCLLSILSWLTTHRGQDNSVGRTLLERWTVVGHRSPTIRSR